MGKAKNNGGMKARRRKRYERLIRLTPARIDVWNENWKKNFFQKYENPTLKESGVNITEEHGKIIFNNLGIIKQKMTEELTKIESLFVNILPHFNEENECELTLEMLRDSKRSGSEYYDIAEEFLEYVDHENKALNLDTYALNTCTFLPLFIEVVEKLITEFDSMDPEDLFNFVNNFLANEFAHTVISDFEGEIICRILDFIYAIGSAKHKNEILDYLNSLEFGAYGMESFYRNCYSETPVDKSEAMGHLFTETAYLKDIWDANKPLHDSYVFLSTIINAANALFKNLFEKHPELVDDKNCNFNKFASEFIEEFNNPDMNVINPKQDQQEIPPMEIDHNELGAK